MRLTIVCFTLLSSFMIGSCTTSKTPTLPIHTKDSNQVGSDSSGKTNFPKIEGRTEIQVVQDDVRRMLNAVYQSDVQTTLFYTHPKLIAMMGGNAKATEIIKQFYLEFKQKNMKLVSMHFPEQPTFLTTDMYRYVIVPTLSVISVDGQRIESLNYQFGVQNKGTSGWKYLEGSRINNQTVNIFFPDFPTDFKFPETYRKKIIHGLTL